MRDTCLPVGLDLDTLQELEHVVTRQIRLKKHAWLYRAGEHFSTLYAIRVGSCKTSVLAEDGHEQITGFHMLGDIIGLDGIATERHRCQAVALEDTEICVLPFEQLEGLARRFFALQHNLHRFLSAEIGRDQNIMLLLGSMHAEQRLAIFLLNLSDRYRQHGYSECEFQLRMTRAEIGNYLGLKIETVSRLVSRFQAEGLLQAQGRAVKLLDMPTLRQLAGQRC
jgi:CRP/FNR family transcriptional regulator